MGHSHIVILGSRGMVGTAIAAAAGTRAVRAARPPITGDAELFDALTDDATQLVQRTQPQAVVIAFGISGVHTCASDPVTSRRLNVDRVMGVAAAATASGALPVLFSTDSVFDGSDRHWGEQDVPAPVNEYGRQKLAAERAIAHLGRPYLLLRLSRVIADHAHRRDLLYQWCDQIRRGERVKVPTDLYFTPIAAADLGRIAVQLIDSEFRGLINVAGPRKISSPELLDMLGAELRQSGVTNDIKVELCRVADLPGMDRRLPNTMLSIKLLEEVIAPKFQPLTETVRTVAARAFSKQPTPIY